MTIEGPLAGGDAGPKPGTRIGRWIRNIEVGLLAAIFLAVVVLGLTQIGLRNFAGTTLVWADPAMRAGVLWITMLASVLAAGNARHIRIDVLAARLPDRIRPWVARAIHFATALVCIALAVASVDLLQLEFTFRDTAFLDVPRWAVLIVIPVGFALMGWRFMRNALNLPPSADAGS
ncbi:MAG: TRAP transporter small permease subunit [Wenzhouxiangellaceae bacterium]|nr:TRAP transporter small permease subunit [Wenzhouxiangellaceae bacterium]